MAHLRMSMPPKNSVDEGFEPVSHDPMPEDMTRRPPDTPTERRRKIKEYSMKTEIYHDGSVRVENWKNGRRVVHRSHTGRILSYHKWSKTKNVKVARALFDKKGSIREGYEIRSRDNWKVQEIQISDRNFRMMKGKGMRVNFVAVAIYDDGHGRREEIFGRSERFYSRSEMPFRREQAWTALYYQISQTFDKGYDENIGKKLLTKYPDRFHTYIYLSNYQDK